MSRPSRYGKMGHSFDSESNSAITSPPLSPREVHSHLGNPHRALGVPAHSETVMQPMYYVQSPSRDSFTFNEGDSLSQSFAAKSLSSSGSPLDSPLHKSFSSKAHQHQHHHQQHHHSVGPAAAFHNGNPRPGSRRVLPQPNAATGAAAAPAVVPAAGQKKGFQPWNGGGTIQEEEESLYSGGRRGLSRWCTVFLSIVFAILCAVIVGTTYWLVCRPSPPTVEVRNIGFQSFLIAEGDDPTGVPTQVLTVNMTTTLNFGNPSKYFGFHVSDPDVQLYYQQIQVAEGKTAKFFQKKRSAGTTAINVNATRTPVYGAGPNLLSTFSSGDGVPLQLHIGVQSEAHVIWKIVRPKYKSNIACDVLLDTNSTRSATGMLKILSQDCHRGGR